MTCEVQNIGSRVLQNAPFRKLRFEMKVFKTGITVASEHCPILQEQSSKMFCNRAEVYLIRKWIA